MCSIHAKILNFWIPVSFSSKDLCPPFVSFSLYYGHSLNLWLLRMDYAIFKVWNSKKLYHESYQQIFSIHSLIPLPFSCIVAFCSKLFSFDLHLSSWHSDSSFALWGFSPSFLQFVQFSHSVMSDSLRPHELQHVRPPCPSPTPRVHSNSRPWSPWCHPAISSSVHPLLLPPIPPSIRVFSSELTLRMRWPKYWSFSFSIIPSKEIPGLISFGMDWLDLLAVQGTLKSLLQHHSSKASILWRSAFFTVQLSHPYMTIT